MESKFIRYAKLDVEAALSTLQTHAGGLHTTDIPVRTKQFGRNIIPGSTVRWYHILLRQFRSPFIYLLFGAAALAFFLGEITDALFILLFITINTLLGFYQEYRSEQTSKLLHQFIESQVRVLRDGMETLVSSENVVPGDIVFLSPGDIAAADIRLIETKSLVLDESLLTGESETVSKTVHVPRRELNGYDISNIIFGGTTVISGSGRGVVIATGAQKVLGRIAKATLETKHVSSFEKGVGGFSKFILRVVLVTLVLMVLMNLIVKGQGVDVPELILFAVALAVSVIPEALPVVTTFSLSQGARRLAQKKVVVKRLSAIEDLGSISVLCSDKTGTITQNKLELVSRLSYKGADVHYWGALGSAFVGTVKRSLELDSFDSALKARLSEEELLVATNATFLSGIPFDPLRRRTTILTKTDGKQFLVSKGSPEHIMALCKHIEKQNEIEEWIRKEGHLGRRIVGVAYRSVIGKSRNLTKLETGLTLAGLLSYEDPLKSTALEAVQKARALGVSIKILTGDRPEVAGAVGVAIGLTDKVTDVLTGDEFERMDARERAQAVTQYHVFARTTPVQKYEIVNTLKQYHEVGFLGEGINDAPALKIAHVGIVVQSASDISKEAADIILLQKSLITIIEGIEEGRKVFSNTVKYIRATLTSNFGNFYAIAISSLFIPFLPMLPVQILLVNLLSDFPMIAVATDNVDPEELMSPKSYQVKEVAIDSTILGIVSTVFDFLTFALFFKLGESILQTNWFMVSILTELFLLFSIRTRKLFFKTVRVSKAIIILTLIAVPTTILLPFTDVGRNTFRFVAPTGTHLATIVALVTGYFVATETAKMLLNKLRHSRYT